MFTDILILSLKNLLQNKLRSFLSVLGIVIGVFTIVIVFALSKGVEATIKEQLKFLSVTSIFVEISDTINGKSKLSGDDTYDVIEKSDNVIGATTMELGKGNVIANNKTESFNIIGTTETFAEVMFFDISHGKYFKKSDVVSSKKVVAIGEEVVNKVFGGNNDVIGKSVYVGSTKFKIVGIIDKAPAMPGFDLNAAVYIPFSTSQKFVLGKTSMMALVFLASDVDSVNNAVEDIRKILREKHKIRESEPDDFNVYEQKTMIQAVSVMGTAISGLVIGVAAIILIVSGIGIMNVMIAAVAERTKDIGISRAIGARRKDILTQFLIESVILTLIGGLIGIFFSEGLIAIVNIYSDIMVRSNLGDIFALSFAFIIGIFFGLYPARKATRLDVVESLK